MNIAWYIRYALACAGLCRHNFHPPQGTPGFYRTEILSEQVIDGRLVQQVRQHGRNAKGVEYTVDHTAEWWK